VLSTF